MRCAADIKENMDAGRISAMLTLEDGVCIDGRMERVQQLYDRGVRMIALTWNYENSIGFPNSVDPSFTRSDSRSASRSWSAWASSG